MKWIKNTSANSLKVANQKAKQQQFLWLISAISLIIFSYHYYKLNDQYYLLIIGLISLIISFILPKLILPFLYIWIFIGSILSEISSTIILGVVYFIGFLLLRIFNVQQKTTEGWITNKTSNFNEQF